MICTAQGEGGAVVEERVDVESQLRMEEFDSRFVDVEILGTLVATDIAVARPVRHSPRGTLDIRAQDVKYQADIRRVLDVRAYVI